MVIIGYQGIGKTLISKENIWCIDLESSNFKYALNYVDPPIRDEHWYIPYCQIAVSLSQQGYDVFVSSHKEVREHLWRMKYLSVLAIAPSVDLKDLWIERLEKRMKSTGLDKDKFAYLNAVDRYEENVVEVLNGARKVYEITSMDYDLLEIISNPRLWSEI